MRTVAILLSFLLSFNVMASSGTVSALEKALDDYQYALTVEWDQRDDAFLEIATQGFYAQVSKLLDKGLTQKDMMSVLSKKVRDSKSLEALKLKLNIVTASANSTTELGEMMAAEAKNLYSTGASWDGYYVAGVGISIVVIALFAFSIWETEQRECVSYTTGPECGWFSYYQGGPEFYRCYEVPYCSEWKKK